jgi:hypothetical protein
VPTCLEPLSKRIISSDVPADFQSDEPATDPALVEETIRLSRTIEETAQPKESSTAALKEIEDAFGKRIQYVASLDDQHRQSPRIIRDLKHSAS